MHRDCNREHSINRTMHILVQQTVSQWFTRMSCPLTNRCLASGFTHGLDCSDSSYFLFLLPWEAGRCPDIKRQKSSPTNGTFFWTNREHIYSICFDLFLAVVNQHFSISNSVSQNCHSYMQLSTSVNLKTTLHLDKHLIHISCTRTLIFLFLFATLS